LTETAGILTSKLRRAAAQLPYLPRALFLVWEAARGWTTAWLVLLLIQGLLPTATVYLTRDLVNSLVAAIRGGGAWDALRPLLVVAGLMAAVLLLSELLRGVSSWIRTAQADLVQDHISSLIHQKSIAVDLGFYDSAEFYDHLHRARAEASYRPVVLLDSVGSLLQNGITLAAMLAVLVPFGPWLPAALILSTLPAFYAVLRYAVRQHRWRLRTTADERRTWYYDWLLTAGDTAAELRLFALGDHFASLYQGLRRRLRDERLKLAGGQTIAELGSGALALLISGGASVWMVWRAIRGLVSLGDLALFYQAFQQGLRLMRSLLDSVAQVYQNSLFLGNLFEFLALELQLADGPVPVPSVLRKGIRFVQVSFRYPGTVTPILQDFSLAIPAGQIVAIMGPNGAGKSTLFKLLCRFYDPDDGRIELEGMDLRSLKIADLRRRITVLFQQPVHYNATALENIALGDLKAAPVGEAIQDAAREAGADTAIRRLPQGYQNLLGRWFAEGSELSTGEWQRLALARALFRRAPLIILDEPTSALDPWAEADWLERFRHSAGGQTAILITHRFTTAMMADRICVMERGRIAECGTHQELLAARGRYAEWWAAQRNQ
jgi:ATP-binding cassette subfamily B protein